MKKSIKFAWFAIFFFSILAISIFGLNDGFIEGNSERLETSIDIKQKNNEKLQSNFTDRIPVLTFHRLVPGDIKEKYFKKDQWVGSIEVFEEMMKYLHDNGYNTISTLEFYDWYTGKVEYDKKTVLICFDDGFYEDYYYAYPILRKYNLKATSFLVGSRIKPTTTIYSYNEETYKNKITYYINQYTIDKVRNEYPNLEFQSHTYDLHSFKKDKNTKLKTFKVNMLSYEELSLDAERSLQFGFKTLAYPYGQYNALIKKILQEKGYLVAFRFTPSAYATRKDEQYAVGRIKINGDATIETLKKWLNY